MMISLEIFLYSLTQITIMNKLLVASLVLIILMSIVVFFYQLKPRVKILSNTTELYSLFTPYMESEVT